ncbi:magnesium transporter MgtE N-terminal domain-containing protein [Candidatus Omnitrophota bacterium]
MANKNFSVFIYFSDILKCGVFDREGRFVGALWDVAVNPKEIYPKTAELILSSGFLKRRFACVTWDLIDRADDNIYLKIREEELEFNKTLKPFNFLLKRDILDQQVVDTYNSKVIRVNDIHLLKVDQDLMVAHVDIGLRGLVRRMGWEAFVDFMVGLIAPQARYLQREELIAWKFIHPVSVNPVSKTLKVNLPQKQFSNIPPADLSEIILDLDGSQKLAFFKTLDLRTKADIFENMEFEHQKVLLKELDKKEAAGILGEMSPDEATDLLEKLPPGTVKNLLSMMESNMSRKLSTLLGYSSDSAGGIMTTDFVSLSENMTVGEAIEHIKEKTADLDYVYYVYIIDDKNRLKATTTIRMLLFSENLKEPITNTVFSKAIYSYLHDSTKQVAYLFDKYKLSALPVVDENKVLHGVITIDDVLSRVILLAWRKRPKT